MRRQVLFGAAVSVCGTMVLAGCGAAAHDSVTAASLTPVAAVAKMASSAKSVRSASYQFRMSGPLGSSFAGHGSYSAAPKPALDLTFDSAPIAGSLNGMEERIVDDTLYLRMPNMPNVLGLIGGGKWLKLSSSDAGNGSGIDIGGLLTQSSQADPNTALQTLISSPNVHEVGKDQINGVETTHYTGDLTAADITRNSAYDAKTRAELAKLYSQSGVGSTHLDVWIDKDSRARKFTSTTPSPVGAVSVAMTFLDYDKPVTVTAPDPADVTDLAKSFGSSGGTVSQHFSTGSRPA